MDSSLNKMRRSFEGLECMSQSYLVIKKYIFSDDQILNANSNLRFRCSFILTNYQIYRKFADIYKEVYPYLKDDTAWKETNKKWK